MAREEGMALCGVAARDGPLVGAVAVVAADEAPQEGVALDLLEELRGHLDGARMESGRIDGGTAMGMGRRGLQGVRDGRSGIERRRAEEVLEEERRSVEAEGRARLLEADEIGRAHV